MSSSKDPSRLKMVLAIRDDLKMGRGKLCSQSGHASVGAVIQMMDRGQRSVVDQWDEQGETKISLQVNSEEELVALSKAAKAAGIPYYLVTDAGRTEVDPGTKTVLAIGPGRADKIDKITGQLKLLH